jgi:hypothetical protein
MVNYEEAVKKPFTDLAKLFVGIILSAIPIVNWVAQGFIIECSSLGKNKSSKKMPDWKNFGDLFLKGLLSYIIIFIYAIPAIIVFAVTLGYVASSVFPSFVGIMPEGFISSVMAGQVAPKEGIGELISQNWMRLAPTIATVSVALVPLALIGMVLLVAAVYLSPIAVLNYLKNKSFGKAFDLGFVISKALTLKYLIVWLIAGITSMVLKSVLVSISWLGPWIGSAIAFFISSVIAYSLYGQAFKEIKSKK